MRWATALAFVLIAAGTAAAQTTVTASWDRNTDTYTTGYRLYYGTASGSYQWSLDAGNAISLPVTLTPGSTYYFVVRGYNQQGEMGPASAEATINLTTSAPTAQITATMQSANTALVTWQTTNATSATLNGASVALSGSQTVTVSAATTYTLIARAADGRTATANVIVTPVPAPTAQITATMQSANTAVLNWQTANATSATLNGAGVALSGSQTVTVSAATTYTLIARAADGRTATANVIVTPVPAPTAQITATMQSANTALLTWQTAHATSATLNGAGVALSGSQTVTVSAATTYTLIARAADGRTATANVIVTPVPAPTAQITATMQSANSARLDWSTTNATSATLNGAGVALSGSQTVTVSAATTYTLIARAADGRTATANVVVTPVPAPTAQITATMQSANSARLDWSTTNATSATLNGAGVALSGSQTVTVSAATTYTLIARAADGRTATANVVVTPVPAPTAQITATMLSATSARLDWSTTNATSATLNGAAVALSGSQTVTVSAQTTYTVIARAADGRTATANVVVTPVPAPTAQITATMLSTTSARLDWSTTNATSATLNGAGVALSGSQTVTVSAATTYTVVARAADGRTASANVIVTPVPAPTAQITATMLSATSARLNWSTTNATSATLNGAGVALSGSQTVTVSAATTYTVVARAADGRTASANVIVTPVPAPTAQITATMLSATSARLNWSTTNATSATLNGAGVALSGSQTVTVSAATTYTVVARAADGRTASANVIVTPVPAPTAHLTASMQSANVALVTWQTTNAASANINGIAVALVGSQTVTISERTTFTLTALAADGRTATSSATVAPQATPAPTAQITATLQDDDESSPQADSMVLVAWQTTNAASASINGNSVSLSGSTTVAVTATTTFTITAVASDGRTASASSTVTITPPTAPGSPRNMSATVSGSRATLRWQAPTTGGAPTHYLIYVGTRSGYSNIANGYNVGNLLSVYGDLPRGTYYARSRAANAVGTSLNSNEVRFYVGRRLRSPTGVRIVWRGTTATISWVASAADTPADVPSNYVLEAGTAPGESNVATMSVGNTTSFTVDVPSGTYYVRIKAENAEGESDPSEEIEVRTPGTPQAPTALFQSGSGAEVILGWTAPTGGYEATGYVIEAGSAPGLANLASIQVGNVTRFQTIAPPGTYYVRVRALNESGTSLPSNEIVVRR